MAHTPLCTYGQLYLDHHGWLQTWLRQRLGCGETAADLAHDAFLRLLHRQDRSEPPREPRALLTTIARGMVINHWRRREIEQAYLEALTRQPQPLALSPEEQQSILETLYEIDALLSELPDRVRRAFLMAQLDGLTYREIAAVLGVSQRMIKKYMARAMLHLLALED